MEIFGPLLISSIAGLSTVFGALVIFIKVSEKKVTKFITLALSFSLAIMIGISITDLIPNSLFNLMTNKSLFKGFLMALIAFIMGIILIKILDKKISQEKITNNLYKLGILNMIALMLHNFPEGIATFLSAYQDMSLGLKLGLAIMFHNIPEGISIAVPIYYATKNKKKALTTTFLSGLAEPLGAILAFIFLKNYITQELISLILLLVAGIMITISIEEMYPEAQKYGHYKIIYLGFILGIITILINHFFM